MSPQILPIPGTGSAAHAEENIAAAGIELSPDEVEAIGKGGLIPRPWTGLSERLRGFVAGQLSRWRAR
jgi:diketogulonate reductase-like aldo/keto reductase